MIRLLFTESDGLISWAIRRLTKSRVSHVGVQVDGMVISAERQGAVEQSLDVFLGGRRTLFIFEATDFGMAHLDLGRLLAHLGDGYAFGSARGFLSMALTGARKNPVHEPKRAVCSELVLFLGDDLVPEFEGLDPETTTPQVLLDRLLAGGPTFRQVYPAPTVG